MDTCLLLSDFSSVSWAFNSACSHDLSGLNPY